MKRILIVFFVLISIYGVSSGIRKTFNDQNQPKQKYILVEAQRRLYNGGNVKYSAYEPFKTRTVELLAGYHPPKKLPQLSKYGGWIKHRTKATGFFHVEKIGDRWWGVDPEGYQYINVALNSISMGKSERNEKALVEKFGSPENWIKKTIEGLHQNGFNCAGSWSDYQTIIEANKTAKRPFAYTINWNFMSSYGRERGGTFQQPGHIGYPNDAIFVFDPEFETFCDRHARQLLATKDDPNLFGHFSDNEMPFKLKSLDNFLALPDNEPGHLAAVQWMKERGITKEQITDQHREAFMALVGEKYFSVVSKAIKKYDPNHMYIGARFYSEEKNHAEFMKVAGKYLDLISNNYYNYWTPDFTQMANWTAWTGKPFIVTEYYTKGEDSGMPNQSGAGWIVRTQRDRGLFYQNYNLALLESKNCVGWHYFKYQDNDPTAKGVDPSNIDANKGIVNNDYEWWKPMTDLMKELNTQVYSLTDYFDEPVLTSRNEQSKIHNADIIIYGGTSAAVTAAVEAVQSGKTVLVVSPDTHLGGLSSGGLGFTDTGNKSTIGGLSREFYHRVWLHYNDSAGWKWQKHSEFGNKGQGTVAMDGENRTMWIFEPHVAEQVFEDFIAENKITVLRDEWLDRTHGLVKENGKIISFKTLSGKTFSGQLFIDATYEGDLMAAAGVTYRVGREACSEYNETWNGVQAEVFQHGHHFKAKIDPYKTQGKPESGLLYGISPEPIAPNCSGDNKIQAYCFRLCMSNNADNLVPFPKPENYDPANYELLGRVFDAGWNEWFAKFDMIPNRKTDTNNHGPFSSDFIGMNYDYPEASYERRKEIIKAHEDYQKGLLYYVANDKRVPQEIHDKMQQWGLAKDEFSDNGNWSYQLYIREARRMVGVYVTSENDVLAKREVPEPIGMGSYAMDSHNVQRYVTTEGFVQDEGDIGVSTQAPYSISYGSIIPKKEECTNLLVPVCVSSTHIAYGSIRMEPVFMILGQSAAIAACKAIDSKIAIQDVDYSDLRKTLLEKNQVLNLP